MLVYFLRATNSRLTGEWQYSNSIRKLLLELEASTGRLDPSPLLQMLSN